MRFAWAGFVIDSDVALDELEPARRPSPVIRFERTRRRRVTAPPWHHHWRFEDGRRWLSIARRRSGFLLRFRHYADFHVAASLDRVEYDATRCRDFDTVRHLFLDQVMPAVASAAGHTVIHACAVKTPVGGVGFIGRAGQGKSTLGAYFGSRGDRIITDDSLVLSVGPRARIIATPSYPSVRLARTMSRRLFGGAGIVHDAVAEYSAKVRVAAATGGPIRFAGSPVPMRGLYVLQPVRATAEPRIEVIPARDQYLAMFNHTFRLDPWDRDGLRTEMDRLAALVRALPVRRVAVPRTTAVLPRVREMILEDLNAG